MALTLAVDPGSRKLGYALFDGRELLAVGTLRAGALLPMLAKIRDHAWVPVDLLVVERPQIYRTGRSKADPNDLITVALVAGCAVGAIPARALALYLPREWNKGRPKGVTAALVREMLGEPSRARLDAALATVPKTSHEDILDAVGVGLHAIHERENRK